jgi:hypothetical protein
MNSEDDPLRVKTLASLARHWIKCEHKQCTYVVLKMLRIGNEEEIESLYSVCVCLCTAGQPRTTRTTTSPNSPLTHN